MLYSELITELRRETRDLKYKMEENFDGDGTTATFVLKHHPVVENSQQILVSGVLKSTPAQYAWDADMGEIVFITSEIPPSVANNVLIDYRYCNFNDADWVNFINNGIEFYGERLWKEILDNTTFTTVLNQFEYDLTTMTSGNKVFRLVDAWYKTASNAQARWIAISTSLNVRFFRDSRKLHLNPPFRQSGYPMQIRAIRKPNTFTTTSATLDLSDEEIKCIKEYAKYQYYMSIAALKTSDLSALSKDPTVSPARDLLAIAKMSRDNAEAICHRIKKPYPAQHISNVMEGITS